MTPAERHLLIAASALLETVRTCYRFPGSQKALAVVREDLLQYGVINRHGVIDQDVDCYTAVEKVIYENTETSIAS